MILLYVVAELYLLAAFVATVKNRKYLSIDQRASAYFFMAGNISAVLVQMFIPKILIIAFSASIAILLLYMTLQNPEDYFDHRVGTLNRKAFYDMFQEYVNARRTVDVVALRITDLDYISQTLGWESTEQLLAQVTQKLLELGETTSLYRLSHTKFAYMADGRADILRKLPLKIKQWFEQPVMHEDLSISLNVPTCCVTSPNIVKNPDEALAMIEYYLEIKAKDGIEDVMWGEKEVLEGHLREKRLLNYMRESLLQDGFYVVYQPLYCVNTASFTDAEALIRLKETPELGYVSPEEFIPLAEKNGLIISIGEIVVRKVCDFLKGACPDNLAHININLSVVQCMSENLHKHLTALIDSYSIPHHRITFEITETSAAYSTEVLKNNMNALIFSGFHFALDDYGTGFSSTSYLIDYPFDTVKLDKHIVWEAFKGNKAMSILKNTAQMIKEMDMKIVAEGVETLQQVEVLSHMGFDLLQGFYYTRPLPEENLITFLSEK